MEALDISPWRNTKQQQRWMPLYQRRLSQLERIQVFARPWLWPVGVALPPKHANLQSGNDLDPRLFKASFIHFGWVAFRSCSKWRARVWSLPCQSRHALSVCRCNQVAGKISWSYLDCPGKGFLQRKRTLKTYRWLLIDWGVFFFPFEAVKNKLFSLSWIFVAWFSPKSQSALQYFRYLLKFRCWQTDGLWNDVIWRSVGLMVVRVTQFFALSHSFAHSTWAFLTLFTFRALGHLCTWQSNWANIHVLTMDKFPERWRRCCKHKSVESDEC